MKNYLKNIAFEILKNCQDGLTKVKFAKIIYFVHKGLVSKKLSSVEDLKFIRMPLGPVPVGFMGLSQDPCFAVSKISNSGPVYNSEIYKLKDGSECFTDSKFSGVVKTLCDQLNKLTTSELVEKSHDEPSWINNINGAEYFVSSQDLAMPMPTDSKTMTLIEDNQKLQEKLVEGMLDDIVSGSTSLEYPDQNKQ